MEEIIQPGVKIGIIGGGQLGKMLAQSAQAMGYKVVIWSDSDDCPACNVTNEIIIGDYTDEDKLKLFIENIDVATIETEHIPYSTLVNVAKKVPLYPEPNIVAIAQNRKKEKQWLANNDFPVVPFKIVETLDEIIEFRKQFDSEIVLKTITGGYDGKGQIHIKDKEINDENKRKIELMFKNNKELIVEIWLPIKAELSVIAAKNNKSILEYTAVENKHINHILHKTIAPARIDENVNIEAQKITNNIMNKMNYKGLLCVEFFYGLNGELFINEIAPRPHNSGHYTIDAAETSQFEQTIRAICNLPLGNTKLLTPSVMINLLGDLWVERFEESEESTRFLTEKILQNNSTKLHLYGKKEARKNRKMGHYTTLASTIKEANELAEFIYKSLEDNKKILEV